MNLPIAIPSASNSPASDGSASAPRTPLSASNTKMPDQPTNNGNNQQNPAGVIQMKRKPSRRANTAERRATHNAVERQRRETLNGRFLDLALLLPNLSQIRRPSKSAIVNSSIAHIHASRRHRYMASRELKALKRESDALRRELNDWHDRAGLPRIEEPVRNEGFTMILTGELEVLNADIEDDEDGADGYDGYEDSDEYSAGAPVTADNSEDIMQSQSAVFQNASTFGHNMPPSIPSNVNTNHLNHLVPHTSQGGPMIASNPPAVSFENPAMASLYEPSHGPFSGNQYAQPGIPQSDVGKVAAWNTQLYSALANDAAHQQLQQLQAQRSLFTPPVSAHSLSNGPISASAFNDNQVFFTNFQRQQHLAAMQQQHSNMGHIYGSPDRDDSSSIGSAGGRRRERSGSLNSGSGYGSPQNGSPLGNYEMAGAGAEAQSEYGMLKRFGAGLQINTGMGGHWGGSDSMDGINGLMKQNLPPPISVGGGGNGNGFATMMMM